MPNMQIGVFLAGAMDFDDLLFKMHELLVKFPEVLYKYQHKFSHLLIDEFPGYKFSAIRYRTTIIS
ncbi:MAG: UvrD-helicase domain-containing protein [Bacteroidetes bacterium]|nr:UvrD-helicase domain-containing protein [Bacteroidota bacterium]